MNTLISQLERIASVRNILLALVVMLFFSIGVMPYAEKTISAAAGRPITIPDLTLSYSAAALQGYFAEMGPEGRSLYAFTSCAADIIYPISMATFWVLLLVRLRRLSNASPHWLGLLPLFTLAADLSENIFVLKALHHWQNPDVTTVAIASSFTSIKWGFAVLTMIVALVLTTRWLIKRRSS